MVHVSLMFIQNCVNFLWSLALQEKKLVYSSRLDVVEIARVAWHASVQPLWEEKTCNSAHEQTPLFNDIIDSVLRHREVGRAKDLSEPPSYETSMFGNGNPFSQGKVSGPGTKVLRWSSSDNYLRVLFNTYMSSNLISFGYIHVIILSRILDGNRVGWSDTLLSFLYEVQLPKYSLINFRKLFISLLNIDVEGLPFGVPSASILVTIKKWNLRANTRELSIAIVFT